MLAGDRDALYAGLRTDFDAVARQAESPVEVAARWAKEDAGLVLDWLARTLARALKEHVGARATDAEAAIDETVLRRMDTRNLFCYLDIINRLRARPAGAFNAQSAFESLLIDWSAGLRAVDESSGLESIYRTGL